MLYHRAARVLPHLSLPAGRVLPAFKRQAQEDLEPKRPWLAWCVAWDLHTPYHMSLEVSGQTWIQHIIPVLATRGRKESASTVGSQDLGCRSLDHQQEGWPWHSDVK